MLTNGCGGLKETWTPGTPVLISDHINLTGQSPIEGANFVDLTDLYSSRLRAMCREVDPSLDEGVYVQFPGPHYETPAEIGMVRAIGGHLAGMSTTLEAIAAREAGMEILGISLVTNLAAGISGEPLNHEEVLEAGKAAASRMGDLLGKIVPGSEESDAGPGHRRRRQHRPGRHRRPRRPRPRGRRPRPGPRARGLRRALAHRRLRRPGRRRRRLRRVGASTPSSTWPATPARPTCPTSFTSHVVTTAALLDAMVEHDVDPDRLRLVQPRRRAARPRRDLVSDDARPRPDTFYGVGKVAAEALLSLYADRYGIDAVACRIGSFRDRPETVRNLSTWLSHDDCVRMVDAALTATAPGFAVLYGISANTRAWWDLEPGRRLGYEPQDDAEEFADSVAARARGRAPRRRTSAARSRWRRTTVRRSTALDLECTPRATLVGMSLTIAEAAEQTGLTPDTLRYYERDGLMLRRVDRSTTGHRRYTDADLHWIEPDQLPARHRHADPRGAPVRRPGAGRRRQRAGAARAAARPPAQRAGPARRGAPSTWARSTARSGSTPTSSRRSSRGPRSGLDLERAPRR